MKTTNNYRSTLNQSRILKGNIKKKNMDGMKINRRKGKKKKEKLEMAHKNRKI